MGHTVAAAAMREQEAVDLILKLCQGVGHAHAKGITHRDIKPANILLGAHEILFRACLCFPI